MRTIEIIEGTASPEAARQQMSAWKDRLREAEDAAAAMRDAKPRHFLINYRIAKGASRKFGSRDSRRASLVEIIRSLDPVDEHISTSTWLVKLHIRKASAISGLLRGPLDPSLDGLHVTLCHATNRAEFGVTRLQS